MKVRYREAGGFTGLVRGVDIDTASLPEPEARRLTELMEEAGLEGTRRAGPLGARDLVGYEILVEREGCRFVFRFDDASIPAAADPLLAYLQERSRPLPPE